MELILEQGAEFDNLEQLKQTCDVDCTVSKMPSSLKLHSHLKRVMKLFARTRIALGTSTLLLLVGQPIFSTSKYMPQSTNALDSLTGLIMQLPLLLLPMSSVKNSRSNPSTVHAIFNVIFNTISA